MFAYDLIAINFPWSISLDLEIIAIFFQRLESPSLTSALRRCLLTQRFSGVFKGYKMGTLVRNGLKQLSCSFFTGAKIPAGCNHSFIIFIVNFVFILLTFNNLLWCLLWKYFSSDKVLNVMFLKTISKHQVVLISTSLVDAYKAY